MKTTSMETVSTGVFDKDEEHCLRSKDILKKSEDHIAPNGHHITRLLA